MAKDIMVNGKVYSNVSGIAFEEIGGGTARYREAGEIMEIPTEVLEVSVNGEYDVKEYAAVRVAVPTEGEDEVTLQVKTVAPDIVQKVVTADSGYTGLSSVTVEAIPVQGKTVTPTTGEQVILPDSGKYLSRVVVGAVQVQEKTAVPSTGEQTITPDAGKYLSRVVVGAVQVQEKTAVPSTGEQVILPDSGKYLSRVVVKATAGEPQLTGITVSPATVTIPYNATSGELYQYLTAMSGTYTLSGYTGGLSRDLTAQLSGITVTGELPSMGVTSAVTVGYGGKTATITVTREQNTVAVTGVSLSLSNIELTVGGTKWLYETVEPQSATNKEVIWESTAPSIAKVEKGDYYMGANVTALAAGSAVITVRTVDGGFTASCAVTVEAASVSKHSITYDSTMDGVQTVAFSPMPTEVDDGTSTTISMTPASLTVTADYYSGALSGVDVNEVKLSSAKVGNTKISGTNSITIPNQASDAEISAVPTVLFRSTNQAYTAGTAYAPQYSGYIAGGCTMLYELKQGKKYVYTPPSGIETAAFRVIFFTADKTAMGATAERSLSAGAVTIPYCGGTVLGATKDGSVTTVPTDAKYFIIRHSGGIKDAGSSAGVSMLLEAE